MQLIFEWLIVRSGPISFEICVSCDVLGFIRESRRAAKNHLMKNTKFKNYMNICPSQLYQKIENISHEFLKGTSSGLQMLTP